MKSPLPSMSFLTAFVTRSGVYISLIAPVMLILAVGSIWFAVLQAEKAVSSGRQSIANALNKTAKPVLNQRKLDVAGYIEAINLIGNTNPAVKVGFGKSKDSIVVSVTDPALMPEWFYLLSTVQSYRAGLIWSADQICLKKCDGGLAATAELRAYTQEVSINDS